MDIVRRKLTLADFSQGASIMAVYDKNAPTEVVTDVSPAGLRAIIVQEHGE